MIPVIISGGWGTKMWPVSREMKPKQFIRLFGDKSLFQLNYEALRTKFSPEEIFVSTNDDQVILARKQAPDIPEENFIIEPQMRNQGPATGLIAAILYKKGFVDEPFMLVQVDDLREPVDKFIDMMFACGELAKKESKYITGGFRPDYPVMGVDYLVRGDKVLSQNGVNIYKVDNFVPRDSREQTSEFIKKDNILLHTNHTCMTPRNFLDMLEKHKPEWHSPLLSIINGGSIEEEYDKMPVGPVEDVTQKLYSTGEALVVDLPFKWTDFGTFESLYRYLVETNQYELPNNVIEVGSSGNYIRLDDRDKVVALVGIKDLAVIDTGDVLLVGRLDKSSDIKEALDQVKARKISLT